MQTLYIGGIMGVVILVLTFFHSKTNLSSFVNPEGLLIVLGGTIAIMLMTSKKEELSLLYKMFKKLIFKKFSNIKVKEILLDCSRSIEKGRTPSNTGHFFIDRSIGWLSAGLKGDSLDKLLVDGAKIEIEKVYLAAATLGNLTKYPPALGMIGTVFGIIAIFNGLGTAEGQKSIGVNLAFAMTATLYGLLVANFLVSPLAELLTQAAQEDEIELSMIVETVKLWSEKESTFFIQEHIELYDDVA